MIQMTAKKATRYAGKAIAAGEGFSVKSKTHARLLVAIGKAELLAPKAVQAEQPVPALLDKPKRTYKRKDIAMAPVTMVDQVEPPAPAADVPAWPFPKTPNTPAADA
jgi:hypothetical protein